MARIRTIKPELPSDPTLASCSRDARLCFTYLISQSDDYGFVPAAPRQLVGALFPHDLDVTPEMVGGWVDELVAAGICRWRWTTDGMPVVQLVGWESHQRIDNRRKPVLAAKLDPEKDDRPAFVGNLAANRREPPRARGESPLEPPTSDLRPPTSDLHGQSLETRDCRPAGEPVALAPQQDLTRHDRPGDSPPPTWTAQVAERWGQQVGEVPIGRVGKDLKAAHGRFGLEALLHAVDNFAMHRRLAIANGAERPDNWPQFVRDFVDYLPKSLVAKAANGAAA